MLIELEGLDGSGKETQSNLLMQSLCGAGKNAVRITFPDYEHDWSLFVRMYLSGEFGARASDVNAYTAASFYALDRYASFKKVWEPQYRQGAILVADRYVGSNLIHQTAKLPREQWDDFFAWQQDFEFGKLELPRPDLVLYLDMHPNTSKRLMEKRYQGDETKKDIHEKDFAYLMACREAAGYAARRGGWQIITCCDGEQPFPIQTIHKKIDSAVRAFLAGAPQCRLE